MLPYKEVLTIHEDTEGVYKKMSGSGYTITGVAKEYLLHAALMFIRNDNNDYYCVKNRITGVTGPMTIAEVDKLQKEYFNRRGLNG